MPTEAFLNLDDIKKKHILDAAKKEFASLPYAKVSIFKIARNADISRSGFYYYFKDKKDIYEHILYEIKDDFVETHNLTDMKEVDIFWLSECIFDYIAAIKGTDREELFLQIMTNMTPEYMKDFFIKSPGPDCPHKPEFTLKFDNLKVVSIQEVKGLVFLLANSIVFSVMNYLDNIETYEQGKEKLYQMFEIIKHGALKGEQGE